MKRTGEDSPEPCAAQELLEEVLQAAQKWSEMLLSPAQTEGTAGDGNLN